MLVGASIFGQLPAGTAPIGSVATLQGTNPWIVVQSGTVITSIVSTIPSSVIVGASIFGLPPVNVTNENLNVGGSVVAFQGAGWPGSVAAIRTGQSGTVITSVAGVPTVAIASIATPGQVMGSVAALQATNPWVTRFDNSSILAVPVGSTVTVWQAASIAGTYAEDSAHTSTDRGLFTLGVRNDTTASFVGANLEYTPFTVDSAGRMIAKPFTAEDGTIISYTGSVVSASVTLIQGSAVGLRNYITDFWIANTGSVVQLITFRDGSTSIVGYTIAPATGGSNSPGIAVPLKTNPSQDLVYSTTGTSSTVYVTVKGYQAP